MGILITWYDLPTFFVSNHGQLTTQLIDFFKDTISTKILQKLMVKLFREIAHSITRKIYYQIVVILLID